MKIKVCNCSKKPETVLILTKKDYDEVIELIKRLRKELEEKRDKKEIFEYEHDYYIGA